MKSIDQIAIGEKVFYATLVSQELHDAFGKLSEDLSPIHTDINFAKKNGYPQCIGYGFLIGTILSKIYGTIFPGGSELCLKQECHFPHPYFVGDTLEFKIEVIDKNVDFRMLTVMTTVDNQNKKNIFRGKAVFQLSLSESTK